MAILNRNLAVGTRLVGKYKGNEYEAKVVESGKGRIAFRMDGKTYKSPSGAATVVMGGHPVNGWRFWSIDNWMPPDKAKVDAHDDKPDMLLDEHQADQPFVAEALAYVYIAQFVSPDGPTRAGVLKGDCERYFGQIRQLLSKGDIQEANWAHLSGFVTSAQGTEKAQSILRDRVKASSPRLDSAFAQTPQRLLQYLIAEVFLSGSNAAMQVQVKGDVGYWEGTSTFSNDRPTCFCLLRNKHVLSHRDRLCRLLESIGLMVTARSYVSTRGGEVRDEICVPAPELRYYFDEYRSRAGLAGHWCPEELEEMHTVFHLLQSPFPGFVSDPTQLKLRIPVRYRESVDQFISWCLTRNLIAESVEAGIRRYRINDALWYDTKLANRYQKPLVDFLLDDKPPKPGGHPTERAGKEPTEGPKADEPPRPVGETILVGSGNSNDTDRGLLGWSGKRKVELDMFVGLKDGERRAHAISVFGIPGFGKSYTLGVILEMALVPEPGIRTGAPLPAVVFHYDQNVTYKPEFANLMYPTTEPLGELRELGVNPRGVSDVVVFVPSGRLGERAKEFPRADVRPLLFSPKELNQPEWRLLMGVPNSDALYVEEVNQILRKLSDKGSLSLKSIETAVEGSPFMSKQAKELAKRRLEFASEWIKDGPNLGAWLKPGRMVILDIRDGTIGPSEAMRLCLTSLTIFQQVQTQDGEPMPKIIILDEAHKYVRNEFAGEIVTVVNERRHTATTVIIASQNPDSIPSDVLEKSSVVILHRLTAPNQLAHLKKSVQGLSKVFGDAVAKLDRGKAIVWATESTDPQCAQSGIEVTIRPRFTRHVLG